MWQEHLLQTADGQLLWCEQGTGTPLLFLHGGPGDEHRSLRPLAEPLADRYRCILYDQRGSGGSTLARLDETTLHPDRFVADLEALRVRLGVERLRLVGHSWGATLALLYSVADPQRVECMALIGLGPLNEEMRAVARANRMKPLSPAEREEYARLSAERALAVEAGDHDKVVAINRQRALLGFRGTFYDLERLEEWVEEWLAFEPYRNWRVNQIVGRLVDFGLLWKRLPQVGAPTLVLYGYQDFEPVTQAYLLQAQMFDARPYFINKCGHVPWLEQPAAVQDALRAFLGNSL